MVGGLAGGCFVQGEVFEHGGPAGLDGVAGGVEDLVAGLVGAGALGGRGQVEAAFVDHDVVAAAEQGEAVDVGGSAVGPRGGVRSEERRVGKEWRGERVTFRMKDMECHMCEMELELN